MPAPSDLVSVDIVTKTDARYTFPDVPFDTLNNILKSDWQKNGVFILVNVSGSTLSLPARIVKTISYNEETRDVGVY